MSPKARCLNRSTTNSRINEYLAQMFSRYKQQSVNSKINYITVCPSENLKSRDFYSCANTYYYMCVSDSYYCSSDFSGCSYFLSIFDYSSGLPTCVTSEGDRGTIINIVVKLFYMAVHAWRVFFVKSHGEIFLMFISL